METRLADFIRGTADGDEADAILRKCVHCGFCTATCPTYQLLGDELDGPRGRIYLIKEVLEGAIPTERTRTHLDRCLTCRNCETTCPSGVRYGRLVEIGRNVVERRAATPRPAVQRASRAALRAGLTRPALFAAALAAGRMVRPLLPAPLQSKVLPYRTPGPLPAAQHARRVVLLRGCVQPALIPAIDAATCRVLDRLGIAVVWADKAGCCGSIRHHLNDEPGALEDMRRNVDAWSALLDGGAETIVVNASGCTVMVKEYGHLLRHDPVYAARAARVSAACRDLSEVVAAEVGRVGATANREALRVAFHPPCTLQHGLRIRGTVESILTALGMQVSLPEDSHLCCGSAGTYSLLQPALAGALRDNKLAALDASAPQVIASANIGCIAHLQGGTTRPVRHWIELVDAALAGDPMPR